ncbi:hypothetical protein OEZ85_003947 [Tetradesmus obliquus]|uniref:AtC3H23-like CCCH zinc finger domain-containing protein n=1 Tax=Tetradesmus obliquus TaxID=3088 RepID=A0ABY8UCX4_TETOB|nr:hypothetical protein OEZ85_003947 [Tetradesmus obliquus]
MRDSNSQQQAGRMDAGQETRGPTFDNSLVYDTAEFHLYCRKIIACSKRYSHEWTTCPFAHPGEKAKRRDPRTHQYDCEMCPTVVKGEVCELGAACPHSHHVFESWLHPQKFRTMICKDGEACHREVCFFAHGAEQLRMPTGGPSKLRRQSSSQEEAARQAGAAAAAAVAAGSSSFGSDGERQ